jgi:protoporphyrinogen oxidase
MVVGIGLRDTRLPRYHWVYFPDEETIFHRIAFLSNYSPFMAPRNGANIIAEITVPPSERPDPEKSVQKTIEGLEAVGLIRGDRVEVAKAWFWKYGYVVYDRNYSENVRLAKRELRDVGIITIGRFGLWSYLNMDDVVFSSFEAARALR